VKKRTKVGENVTKDKSVGEHKKLKIRENH